MSRVITLIAFFCFLNERVILVTPQACVHIVEAISAGQPVKEDDLILIGNLPDSKDQESRKFHTTLCNHLLGMEQDPVLSLLTLRVKGGKGKRLEELFERCRAERSAEVHVYKVQ